MTRLDSQLASIDALTLEQTHGGLPIGKIWKAAKNAYEAAAPVVKDVAKKVAPYVQPVFPGHNIWDRATDDK
jgi:hypothetical protein